MQLRKLYTDRQAVAPVVGVVLIIAIAVVLAGVVGTFALGFGAKVSDTPQVAIDFEFRDGSGGTDDALEIRHDSGEVVESSNVVIDASETFQYPTGSDTYGTTDSDGRVTWSKIHGTGTEVGATDAVTVYAASGDNLNDATVEVLWLGDQKSAVLGEWSDS